MATTAQYLVPGGAYVNEVTDASELLVPGGAYVNETTTSAVVGATIRSASEGVAVAMAQTDKGVAVFTSDGLR